MISIRAFSLVAVVVASFAAVGCSGSDDPASSASTFALSGRIGAGTASGVQPKGFGNVDISNGGANVHVTGRELHKRGESGRKVEADVDGNSSFKLDVPKGSRWVFTVDDKSGNSALLQFGDGESALDIGASSQSGTVDIGNVNIEGGEARTDIVIDGKLAGVQATLANLDEVFEAADGAVVAAREAAEAAKKAADAARDAAEAARKAAEAAKKAAGQ
jgi:hypothetical protein